MNAPSAYLVRVTRHFYAGTIHSGRVLYLGKHGYDDGYDDGYAPLVPFESLADARTAIEEMEEEIYRLGHGECSRPTLRAVRVSQAPADIREQLA